jgi:hypothetical protein
MTLLSKAVLVTYLHCYCKLPSEINGKKFKKFSVGFILLTIIGSKEKLDFYRHLNVQHFCRLQVVRGDGPLSLVSCDDVCQVRKFRGEFFKRIFLPTGTVGAYRKSWCLQKKLAPSHC